MSFFSPYAPSNEVTQKILPSKLTEGIRVALYIDAIELSKYNCFVDTDGRIMTRNIIPYSAVQGVWFEQKYEDDRQRAKWIRLMVPDGGKYYVETTVGFSRMAERKTLTEDLREQRVERKLALKWIEECRAGGSLTLEADSQLRKNLTRFIIRRAPPPEGRRICPVCMRENDDRITAWFNCRGSFVVRGEYIRDKSPEVNADAQNESQETAETDKNIKEMLKEGDFKNAETAKEFENMDEAVGEETSPARRTNSKISRSQVLMILEQFQLKIGGYKLKLSTRADKDYLLMPMGLNGSQRDFPMTRLPTSTLSTNTPFNLIFWYALLWPMRSQCSTRNGCRYRQLPTTTRRSKFCWKAKVMEGDLIASTLFHVLSMP